MGFYGRRGVEVKKQNCPTCGSFVTIGGGPTTYFYVPAPKKESPKKLAEQLVQEWFDAIDLEQLDTKHWSLLAKKIVKLIKDERS